MEKRVSLKDIAKKVGVSVALVSYVLNGKDKQMRIGAEVVRKINQTAADMNYEPNQIARSLRMGSTKTIGLVVADISNPFFGQLARIVEDEALKMGYTVIFGSSDEDEGKSGKVLNTFLNRQVDGYIIVPSEGTVKQVSSLLRRKLPVVLFDRYFPEINCSHIILNNFQATFDATSWLLSKGLKKIALVAYKTSLIHMTERIRGFSEAMENKGIDFTKYLVEVKFEQSRKEMEIALNDYFKRNKNTEAIIFANNGLSLEGLYYLQKHSMGIPGDIAFIGFDGGEVFDLYSTPLSYVKQPLEEMGKEAVNVLMESMKGSNKIIRIMHDSELIIR